MLCISLRQQFRIGGVTVDHSLRGATGEHPVYINHLAQPFGIVGFGDVLPRFGRKDEAFKSSSVLTLVAGEVAADRVGLGVVPAEGDVG